MSEYEAQLWRLVRDAVHAIDAQRRPGPTVMADDDVLDIVLGELRHAHLGDPPTEWTRQTEDAQLWRKLCEVVCMLDKQPLGTDVRTTVMDLVWWAAHHRERPGCGHPVCKGRLACQHSDMGSGGA